MTLTVGVDVGGTKIAGGVVDDDGEIVAKARTESPATDRMAIADAIESLVGDLRASHDVEAVGVAAAGFVDADRATVLFAPNLAWRDEPLRDELQDRVGLPVVIENDANAAAWGEFRYGAGEDVNDLLLVALGTGVGGGIVLDGALLRGAFGVAGEIGHMCVVPDGRLCGCGNKGCWEMYSSGTALVEDTRDQVRRGSLIARSMLDRAGGDVDAITGPLITAAAREGDEFAIEQLANLGAWVGAGIASLAAVLDPAVAVLGGGVSEAGDLILEPVRAGFRRALTGRHYRPELQIRQASLGNRAGVLGVADLARRR
jgi:glucokinase